MLRIPLSRLLIPRIAITVLIVLVLLSVLINLTYQTHFNKSLQRIVLEQETLLVKDNELIATELRETVSALELLLERTEILGAPPSEGLRAALFANSAVTQARWLSPDGMELLRFDRGVTGIEQRPESALQDKSNRDYFKEMKKLEVGQIYVSAFNLNIENNEVVVPIVPTVRIGIRSTQGYLLANLSLTHLFSAVRPPSYSLHDTWLINSRGDWLVAPDPSYEWGFILGQPKTLQETLNFPNLERLVRGEIKVSLSKENNSILLATPLNLGRTKSSAARLEIDQPIMLRFVTADYVTEYVANRHLISPKIAYFIGFLVTLLIYILLVLWRNRVVDQAAGLVKEEEVERLVGIANLLPQMTWTTLADGTCDFVNDRWEAYTGVSPEVLVGQGWQDYIHPDDRERVISEWKSALLTGENFSEHMRIRDQFGNYRTFDTRAQPLKNNAGRIVRWFGSDTDIQDTIDLSERLEHEKRILESNLSDLMREKHELLRRLEFASASANIGIWELDLSREQLIWDDRMFAIYGQHRTPYQNLFHLWRESVHPEDLSEIEARLDTAVKNDRSVHLEYRVNRPDGTTVWLRDDASVHRSPDGSRIRLIGCSQDISRTKKLTLSLQEALAHLEQARKVAGIGLFRIDAARNKSHWSKEVFTLLGLPEQSSFTLERLLKCIDIVQRDRFEVDIRAAIAAQTPYDTHIEIRTPTSEKRFLHLFVDTIVSDPVGEATIYGALYDVSKQKSVELDLQAAREEAESSNAAKSAFLANISHEIRTPMNGILGMLSLLSKRVVDEESSVLVQKAHHAAERLMDILNDVLDLSRVDAGKLELHIETIEVNRLLQESVDIFSSNAELKAVDLEIEVSPDIPTSVKTDGLRLGQVVSNLVGNAIKFTEEGGQVRVRLCLDESESPMSQLCIDVIDTGIGMTAQQLEASFAEFTQGDDSISKRYGGTGLGLAICKRLTTLLGGEINLTSVEHQGTTAHLAIPIELVIEPDEAMLPISPCQLDLVTDDASLEHQARNGLLAQGVTVNVHRSLADIVAPVAGADAFVHHLVIDASSFSPSALETLCRAYTALKPNLATYQSETIILPTVVSASLRSLLSFTDTQLLHKRVVSQQIRRVIADPIEIERPEEYAPISNIHRSLAEMTIVSIDDVALNNEVIRGLLADQGCKIELFSNAHDGIERIKQGDVDLVLMDVHMPDMGGLEATRIIKQLPAEIRPLVFGLSASVLSADRQQGLAAGMDEYLTKPFQFQQFTEVLKAGFSEPKSAPASPDSRLSIGTGWPEFINLEVALKRLNGNESTLLRLCRTFVSGFTEFPTEFRTAIEERDYDRIQKLSHRLSGAAAYIGDDELHRLAVETERQAEAATLPADGSLSSKVEEHVLVLNELLNSRSEPSVTTLPAASLPALTATLLESYADHCFVPASEWEPYVKALRDTGFTGIVEKLESAIESNAFQEAASILVEIKRELEDSGACVEPGKEIQNDKHRKAET